MHGNEANVSGSSVLALKVLSLPVWWCSTVIGGRKYTALTRHDLTTVQSFFYAPRQTRSPDFIAQPQRQDCDRSVEQSHAEHSMTMCARLEFLPASLSNDRAWRNILDRTAALPRLPLCQMALFSPGACSPSYERKASHLDGINGLSHEAFSVHDEFPLASMARPREKWYVRWREHLPPPRNRCLTTDQRISEAIDAPRPPSPSGQIAWEIAGRSLIPVTFRG